MTVSEGTQVKLLCVNKDQLPPEKAGEQQGEQSQQAGQSASLPPTPQISNIPVSSECFVGAGVREGVRG